MLYLLGIDDNKKIGMFLLVVSAVLYLFGVFLLFTRSLLLLSNVLSWTIYITFLIGLYFFIGVTGCIKFFAKKGKWKGSVVYFSGFGMIVIGFGLFGALTQIIGFFMIFRSFLPEFYDYLCRIPYVGSYLKSYWLQNKLDMLAGNAGRI